MSNSVSAAQLWQDTISDLTTTGEVYAAQAAFLAQSKAIGETGETLLIAVPGDFAKTQLETKLNEPILRTLLKLSGRSLKIAVLIDENMQEEAASSPSSPSNTPVLDADDAEIDTGERAGATGEPVTSDLGQKTDGDVTGEVFERRMAWQNPNRRKNPELDSEPQLNPAFTFDTYVIGSSNRFPAAAAKAVAEQPAQSYNPLFIYGGSGLGKTHLLHAIGHYARNLFDGIRVKYVNSEEFTNDFINSIRYEKAESFQQRYRQVDILLIDDIQFLGTKERTMEEFFHTFNTLHSADKQVVITSDTPPRELPGIEERLRSRFESGLITDVQPPDLETRIAILRKKAERDNLSVDREVMEYIASRISSNIRELEGSLNRVMAFASLNNQTIDLSVAKLQLKDFISDPEGQEIAPSQILSHVAQYYSTSLDALRSPDRSRAVVIARQVCMYLCRELTDLSLPAIGKLFGGRDHTTVMHSYRKISKLLTEDPEIFNAVSELSSRIRNGTN